MNCNKVQNRLKLGEQPSGEFLLHARSCEPCGRVLVEEESLSRLLGNAGRVGAPADLEARVMTEISAGQLAVPSTLFGLRPAVLLPSAAVLVIGAVLFALYGPYFFGKNSRQIAGGNVAIQTQEDSAPNEVSPVPDTKGPDDPGSDVAGIPVEPTVNDSPSVVSKQGITEKKKTAPPDEIASGSRDLATRSTEPVRPPWAGQAKDPKNAKGGPEKRSFSPREVFLEFGVDAEFVAGGWRVTAVKPRSIGASAGIQIGDVLRSLDGKELSQAPLEGEAVGGKRLIVLRGGKEVLLPLRP